MAQFSIFQRFFEKANTDKAETEFKKEMGYLANKETFTLVDYREKISAGLN